MARVTPDKNGLAKADGTLAVYGYDALTGEFTVVVREFVPHDVDLPACACLPRRRAWWPFIRTAAG